jgi:hypothetical protein
MTKSERAELKSVVKQQMKVLRAEVVQRKAELLAQVDDEIAASFEEEDRQWSALQHEVHEAVLEANRRINDALYRHGFETRGDTERMWVQAPSMRQPKEKQYELRQRAAHRIEARVKDAMLQLDRQEADLLRTLAVGALESEAAQEFLSSIPSVAELVPAARLEQLTDGGGA